MQVCLAKSRTWITDSSAFLEEATCLFPCAFVFDKYSLFGREELTLPSDDTSLEPGRWAFVIHVHNPQGKKALNNPFRLLFSNSTPVVLGRITTVFKDKNYDHLKKKNSIVKDFSIVYSLLNILV